MRLFASGLGLVASLIVGLGSALASTEFDGFKLRWGVMQLTMLGVNQLRETEKIFLDPHGGSNWCFVVEPTSQSPYEVYSVHRLPNSPSSVGGKFAREDEATSLRSKPRQIVGKRSFCFEFDPDDPVGEYRTEVFINGRLATTIALEVVAPMRNSRAALSRSLLIRTATPSCSAEAYQEGTVPPSPEAGCSLLPDAEVVAAVEGRGLQDEFVRVCRDPFSDDDQVFEFVRPAGEPHCAIVQRFECSCYCYGRECRATEKAAQYETDPKRHFELGAGVTRDAAFQLIRMFEAGKLRGTEIEPQWEDLKAKVAAYRVTRVERNEKSFRLILGDCTCGLELVVRWTRSGHGDFLQLVERPEYGCV